MAKRDYSSINTQFTSAGLKFDKVEVWICPLNCQFCNFSSQVEKVIQLEINSQSERNWYGSPEEMLEIIVLHEVGDLHSNHILQVEMEPIV